MDQGSEFISRDLDLWAYANDVILDFSPEDTLKISDYFGDSPDPDEIISENDDGDLVLTNGQDTITFEGIGILDLDWFDVA